MSGGLIGGGGSGASTVDSNLVMAEYNETIADYTSPTGATTSSNAVSQSTFMVWDNCIREINGSQSDRTNYGANDNSTSTYDDAEFTASSGVSRMFFQWSQTLTVTNPTNITVNCAWFNYYAQGSVVIQYSTDGVSWITGGSVAVSPNWGTYTFRTISFTPSTDVKYVRAYGTASNTQTMSFRVKYCQITGDVGLNPSNLYDDNTATYWTSGTDVSNAYCRLDMGSSNKISNIAVYPHTGMTETQILIQTSDDDVTYTTKRTINTADLTTSAWNYIRFNLTSFRYFKIIGNTSSNLAISFAEIKACYETDSNLIDTHGHVEIDSTDDTLPLSGVTA